MPLTLSIDSYNMSELIYVRNLTGFQGFSTGGRNAVDNPSLLGAELGYYPKSILPALSIMFLLKLTIDSSRNIAVVFFFFTLSKT